MKFLIHVIEFSLKLFRPLMEKSKHWMLLPEEFYNRLKDLSVMDKIQIIILSSVVPVLIFLVISFVSLAFISFNTMEEDIKTRSIAVSNSWSYYTQQLKVYTKIVAKQSEIIKELLSTTSNASRMKKSINPLIKELKLDVITIYDKKGIVLLNAHDLSSFGQQEISTFNIKNAIQKGNSDFYLYFDNERKKHVMVFTMPIKYEKEIIGAVSLGNFINYQLASRIKKSSGTNIFIASSKQIEASSFGELKNKITLWRGDLRFISMKLLKREFNNSAQKEKKQLEENVIENHYFDNRKIMMKFLTRNGQSNQLFLIAVVDNFNTRVGLIIMLVFIAMLTIVTIVFSILTAGKISSIIQNSILELKSGIKNISGGDLDYKIPEIGQDEFGDLAKSFNLMGEDLDSAYADLRKLNDFSLSLSTIRIRPEAISFVIEKASELLNAKTIIYVSESNGHFVIIEKSQHLKEAEVSIFRSNNDNIELKINGEVFANTNNRKIQIKSNSSERYLLLNKGQVLTEHDLELFEGIARLLEVSLSNIEKMNMEGELATAKLVQESLIPAVMPEVDGIDLFGQMIPARDLGGDYFDFFSSDNKSNSTWIMLGDVSGKGLPAGLIMVMARTFLHSMSIFFNSPKKFLIMLNDFLYRNSDSSKFMTAILSKWEADKQSLIMCGAGHESIIIYRADKHVATEFNAAGTILGFADSKEATLNSKESFKNLFKEYRIKLRKKDKILIFTDGVTEARNVNKEEFSFERIQRLVELHNTLPIKELIQKIIEEVKEYSAGAPQHDDITIIGIEKT